MLTAYGLWLSDTLQPATPQILVCWEARMLGSWDAAVRL